MAVVLEREMVKVIVKEVGKPAVIKEIGTTLKDYQNEVLGDIESIPFPGRDDIDIVINDMGKLNGMQPNLLIPEYGDIIMGRFFVIGVDEKECTWKSLTEEQAEEVLNYIEKYDFAKIKK